MNKKPGPRRPSTSIYENNYFLTSAAGSGKIMTLKEILRRIRRRKK
jgi:hypothetical protein